MMMSFAKKLALFSFICFFMASVSANLHRAEQRGGRDGARRGRHGAPRRTRGGKTAYEGRAKRENQRSMQIQQEVFSFLRQYETQESVVGFEEWLQFGTESEVHNGRTIYKKSVIGNDKMIFCCLNCSKEAKFKMIMVYMEGGKFRSRQRKNFISHEAAKAGVYDFFQRMGFEEKREILDDWYVMFDAASSLVEG
jgi:hypothetical protein